MADKKITALTKLGSPGVFDRAAKYIISEKDNEK